MSDALYAAKATSTGGGRDGHVKTAEGQIDLDVRPPKELGGSGDGVNPEQLVAAGWAACFNGALQKIMGQEGVKTEQKPEVTIECALNKDGEGFKITAAIEVTIYGVDQAQAQELADKAHAFCPYSKAMRGNVDPEVKATAA